MNQSSRQQLLRIAHERLYPSLTNPNFLVLNARREIFRHWISELPVGPLKILDVGGRYQPYRPLFERREARYVACDLERTNLVDVVADGEFLPFDGSVFDVVICTQVFEYFPHPIRAAQEIHRVLKPGGRLLMSVVACAPRFVEEERWRYTPLGIRTLLSSFGQLSIVPETSSFGGLMRFLSLAAHSLSHFQLARKCVEFLLCPCLNLLGLAGEKLRISRNDEFTPNYSVLAIK